MNTSNVGPSSRALSFIDWSAVTGLDFADDGRALAVVDWDGDGDLDVWLRNRSAPRLRLLINRSDAIQQSSSIKLRLTGSESNTQAVGARVELIDPERAPAKVVRTVHVGDAFLSQSATDLHFGMGGSKRSKTLDFKVRWPAGTVEVFKGITPGTHEVIEGRGAARRLDPRRQSDLQPGALPTQNATVAGRVILPGRVKMPPVNLLQIDSQAEGTDSTATKPTATLLVFWSSGCPNCRRELSELATERAAMARLGISVKAVCLDGLDADGSLPDQLSSEAQKFIRDIDFPYPVFNTDKSSLELIAGFQRALFDTHPEFVIPLSCLVDRDGNLVTFYRGSVSAKALARDSELANLDDRALRELAAPLGGRWITEPATKSQFSEFVGRRMVVANPNAAAFYFEAAAESETDPRRREQLRQQHARLRRLAESVTPQTDN